MIKTQRMISEMMRENTGVHMLDSGGAYGRAWQRNQLLPFETFEASTVDFSYGYINLTHNLFHWLVERLEYCEEADDLLHKFAETRDSHESWLVIIPEFMDWLQRPVKFEGNEYCAELSGIYSEGQPVGVNTANHDSLLSQVIQYEYFNLSGSEDLPDGTYIILQIHGGCDVRGGYTAPRVFVPRDMYGEEAIFFDQDGTVSCQKCGNTWHTDDGYHYYDEQWSKGNLEEYDIEDISDVLDSIKQRVAQAHAAINEMSNGNHMPRLLIIADGVGYCPDCGNKLEAY